MSENITPRMLLRAYAMGVFPMSEGREDPEVFWVDPRARGVFPLGEFRISRSLARRMRRSDYSVSINRNFSAVVEACAARETTWISGRIFDLYQELHHIQHAHSVEIWEGGTLAGGVYGVTLGAAFFGESMFSARRDGSKLALAHLHDHLQRCGFRLFDTQFLTDHLASLGATEISREAYHTALTQALAHTADLHAHPIEQNPITVLMRAQKAA